MKREDLTPEEKFSLIFTLHEMKNAIESLREETEPKGRWPLVAFILMGWLSKILLEEEPFPDPYNEEGMRLCEEVIKRRKN
jgi:hypothetical protein